MSQHKSKFKDEIDQPKLTEVWNSLRPQRITEGGHKSRSKSAKRKHSTTPPSTIQHKRQNRRDMANPANEQPDKLEQMDLEGVEPMELDKSLVVAIRLLLQPIRNDVKDLLQSHNDMKENIVELTKLKEENVMLHRRVEEVEHKNKCLSERVTVLENKLLETSIVISGIQESPWETEAVRQEKLFIAFSETIIGRTLDDRLDTARSMYIKGTKRLGSYRSMHTRPIMVEFMHKVDAEYIMNNKKYLGEGIYVDRAYCKETEEARKILRPYWRAARKLPQYQRKCKLEEGTLVLKGLSYTPQNLHKLPPELSGFNISSASDPTTFGYFGRLNPFSNFHPAKFNYEGKSFHCSEQFIQYAKAKHFKADALSDRILTSDTASECKRVAREITNYDNNEWLRVAKTVCEEGIAAKFHQNPYLQKMLLETGNKTIVECCTDPLWGTGVPIQDSTCLDRRVWRNQGIMGEILENIRRDLLQRAPTEMNSTTQSSIPTHESDTSDEMEQSTT